MVTMTPEYNHILFKELYKTREDFVEDILNSFASKSLDNESLNLLYGLLYAKHANDPIANRDINQTKAMIQSIIFRFGPSWKKKLDIQEKLRNLTEEEICTGSKSISNRALNPSNDPSASGLEEIIEINEQNTNKIRRSRIEGYALLISVIQNDVTTEFINKFKECFMKFFVPRHKTLYIDNDEEEE